MFNSNILNYKLQDEVDLVNLVFGDLSTQNVPQAVLYRLKLKRAFLAEAGTVF